MKQRRRKKGGRRKKQEMEKREGNTEIDKKQRLECIQMIGVWSGKGL